MSRLSRFIDLTTPEPEPLPRPRWRQVEEIDLTSPPPEPRPRHESKPAPTAQGTVIDLTDDLSDDPDEIPKSSSELGPTSKITRPKSTPSTSFRAGMFSTRSNLDQRSTNSPAIKSSSKTSKQVAQREQGVAESKPGFRPSSSNFPNLLGLERPTKQGSIATSIEKRPDTQRTRRESLPKHTSSTGVKLEGSGSKTADTQIPRRNIPTKPDITPSKPASTQQTKRTNLVPATREPKPLSTLSQSNNVAPELISAHTKLSNTSAPRKSIASVPSNPASTPSQRRSIVPAPESAQPNPFSTQTRPRSIVPELEILQPRQSRVESQSKSTVIQPPELVGSIDFEELLGGFKEDMESTHGFNVAFLLEEASKMASQSVSENQPVIEVSAFASMKSIEHRISDPKGSNVLSFKTGISDQKGKIVLSTSYAVPSQITSNYVPIPKYTSLTFIHRNILSPDDGKIMVRPQEDDLGNKGKALNDDLDRSHMASPSEPYWQAEYKKLLYGNIQFWLEEGNVKCSQEDLEKYLVARNTDFQMAYKKRHKASYHAKINNETYQAALQFTHAFNEVFKEQGQVKKVKKSKNVKDIYQPFNVTLQDVLLSNSRKDELLEHGNSDKSGRKSLDNHQQGSQNPMSAVEAYTTLACLICGVIECQTHGEFTEEWNERQKDKRDNDFMFLTKPERITIQPGDLLRKHLERREELKINKNDRHNQSPCSRECHLVVGAGPTPSQSLSGTQINDISLLVISLGSSNVRCCYIAFALGLPCFRVFREIDRQERGKKAMAPPPKLSEADIAAAQAAWYDNQGKVLCASWKKMTNAHDHETRTQAVPCHHAGPCSKETDCPCFEQSLLCEDICSCSDDCPRRFTGCSCRSNGKSCLEEMCICKEMNRECGPRCSCGALERLNPANRHNDDLFATGCQNVVLQRGVPKATLVGISQLAGQGLYAGEPILKGDYIDEYCGELISHGEAERRGIIYDHHVVSFLFDLNSEWTLDGQRYANNTRFINHASHFENGLNCKAEILWVNGEHRIKFYALRDIKAGEELLFDYGKEFAEKHNLTKKLPKMKISKKLAAEVAKNNGASQSGRGGRATRGTHGSSGRARKQGQKDREEVVEEEIPDEQDPEELEILNRILEDAGNDDDDYEEGGRGNVCYFPGCSKVYARIDNLRAHQKRLRHNYF